MSVKISISDCVAGWQKLSSFSKINSVVWEWFVTSSAIDYISTNKIFGSTWSDRRAESLNLPKNVRILIQSLLAERSEIVECTLFIKVILEYKFSWNSRLWLLYSLTFKRFHWRHWSWLCLHRHIWCHSILSSEHWYWVLSTKCLLLIRNCFFILCIWEWFFHTFTY